MANEESKGFWGEGRRQIFSAGIPIKQIDMVWAKHWFGEDEAHLTENEML
jgi:hypothetical protein